MDLTKEELRLLECFRSFDARGRMFLLSMASSVVMADREARKEGFKVLNGGDISVEGDNNTVNILVL